MTKKSLPTRSTFFEFGKKTKFELGFAYLARTKRIESKILKRLNHLIECRNCSHAFLKTGKKPITWALVGQPLDGKPRGAPRLQSREQWSPIVLSLAEVPDAAEPQPPFHH